MRLITPYAPGSFCKPVLIVDTVFNSKEKETAIAFVSALNPNHALGMFFGADAWSKLGWERKCSEWIIVKKYDTLTEAVQGHLAFTRNFINGGTTEEWDKGWDDYLKLYEKYCPENMREEIIK